ncbi:TasA family protein [Arthrobacter sp. ZGTC131]|uniref:TasA family protein n=1 Tax=Arthrobacter sp. ZGTC131 TaxID=2058898 RepID=UPI000CE4D2B4|nr:TasA family protein [Arthrobacter sp. ZGTC131]
MSVTATRSVRRPNPRLLAAFAVGAAGLAITGGGVFAALNATASNTTAQNATSGILSLTMANNGTGFSQAVSNLAPGDVVNRYVTLTQGADLDGKDLTLAVTDATPTLLTTSAAKGLHVTVSQCPGAWTPATGACSGTATPLLTNAPLSTLSTTPGAIKSAIAASGTLNLQISLTLPDQAETTVNGAAPAGTIQGLSSSLTWTFGETQRTATTTGS